MDTVFFLLTLLCLAGVLGWYVRGEMANARTALKPEPAAPSRRYKSKERQGLYSARVGDRYMTSKGGYREKGRPIDAFPEKKGPTPGD